MLPDLEREVLRVYAERVVAERLEDRVALQALEPRITNDVFKVLSLEASVAARTSFGGTAPSRVKEQIAFWKGQTS